MNIVDAFIHFNKQLLILISGISGCGKLALGLSIAEDFKIKLIDQHNYYKKEYNVKYKLSNGVDVVNWYSDDAIDWELLNKDINKYKKTGLVVVGMSFPSDLIKSRPDYHIHLNISKQDCIDRRKKIIEKKKENIDQQNDTIANDPLLMNQLIYPYYLESSKKMTINKFIKTTSINDSDIYDVVFDTLIGYIKNNLDEHNKKRDTIKNKGDRNVVNKKNSIEGFHIEIEPITDSYLDDDIFNILMDDDSIPIIHQTHL